MGVALSSQYVYNISLGLINIDCHAVKANSARPSVTSSRHPKRQAQVDLVASQLGAPTARSPAFRDICLIRDDYRCAITRDLDVERWEDLGRPQNDRKANLEAAHIIPFSFASYKDEDVCLVPAHIMMIVCADHI